eukprot:CAMPEP_0177712000 /NCGR_PEP_ID=MMETSP0484_2-20121128/12165_1 /TAXON_ID=354590 /ORGANISM="Rhodomonas lens, Strain RHODO" /LENGTH=619 /DNA_ID=CAMNT_0019223779 /DNA_START=176 /DNA_END=2032 /DNA_ORIENTATION=+
MAGQGLKTVAVPDKEAAQKIAKVDLSVNSLTRLPKNIGNLVNVAELYLQKNQLSSLTDTYGFHFMLESLANLKVLDLSFNQLKKLPSGIGGLAKLEVLELRGNGFKKLPAEMTGLKKLKRISLEYNRFKKMPAELADIGMGDHMTCSVDRALMGPNSHLYISGGQLVAAGMVGKLLAYAARSSAEIATTPTGANKPYDWNDWSMCPDPDELPEDEDDAKSVPSVAVGEALQVLELKEIQSVHAAEEPGKQGLMELLRARESGGKRRAGRTRTAAPAAAPAAPAPLSSEHEAANQLAASRPTFSAEEQVQLQLQFPPWRNCRRLDQLESPVFSAAFTPDGAQLVAATKSGTVRVYDMARAAKVHDVEVGEVGWSVLNMDVSSDSRWAVASAWSDCVHLIGLRADAPTHDPLQLDPGFHSGVFTVKFAKDNRRVLAGLNHGFVVEVDLETRAKLGQMRAHTEDVNALCEVDREGRMLATGADDGVVKLWDTRADPQGGKACVGQLVGHASGVTCVAAKQDGVSLLSNGKDGRLLLWDLRRGEAMGADGYVKKGATPLVTMQGLHQVEHTLVQCGFSSHVGTHNRFAWSGSADGALAVYDSLTGKPAAQLKGHKGVVRDASW